MATSTSPDVGQRMEAVSGVDDDKSIYNRCQEVVESSVNALNLTWITNEVHLVETAMVAAFQDLEYYTRDAVQPYLPRLRHVENVVRPLIPVFKDEGTRELVVIASVTLVLAVVTTVCFRNPRYRRRQKRKSLKRSRNHTNPIHRRAPSRPTLHRGSDDSLMSKDGSLRSRFSSFDLSFRRRRLTSLDPYWGADHDLFVEKETRELEHGFYENEFDFSSIAHFGPSESKLLYSAWTPPTTWAEASRRVIPQDTSRDNLQRQIIVDVGKAASLKIVEGANTSSTSASMCLPISEWSVHIRTPVEGGVLELYVKNTPKEDWLELTFASANSCAQFQLDLLAHQLFGNTLISLYQALEIVHQGSAAHPGKEFVLHDKEHGGDPVKTTGGGVAWDDAMRALNSLPSIRLSLERLLVAQRQVEIRRERINSEASLTLPTTPKAAENPPETATPVATSSAKAALSLTDEYLDKRLLLGPVDFFRLFVPPLPQRALPQTTNNESRVEHLLRWRKRVARAAVSVQAYVRARTLVNQGWNLGKPKPEQYLVRRLAYDENNENQQRDFLAKNEYYEATVSRDVRCGVRSFEKSKLLTNGGSTTSVTTQRHVLYQAYSLVECHVFRLPKPSRWHKHSLRPNRDPVEALPSLRALISSHPEQDFMVNAFFCEGIRIAMVQVYARSLPKGIDPKFDASMKRYTEGTKETRDSMLQALVYLGQNRSQSFSSWIALRVLFYLLSWTRRCRLRALPRPTMSSDYFLSLPAVNVSTFSETFHYGGGIMNDTTDGNLPSNYVAMSAHIDSRHMPNMLACILHGHIESGVLADTTVDFTLILEGRKEDELPERALSTIRMVHFSPTEAALPISYSSFNNDASLRGDAEEVQTLSDQKAWVPNPWILLSLAKIFIVDPLSELGSVFTRRARRGGERSGANRVADSNSLLSPTSQARSIYLSPCDTDFIEDSESVRATADVVETAVSTIVEILSDLKVPVRKHSLTEDELEKSEPIPNSFEWVQLPPGMSREEFTSVNVLYRSTRSDVKRFLLASEGDVYTAAVRLAESITWRSFTFPVDIRTCRIELQSGQFFQQGKDRDGNPVFYFRNMCLGPWRKDEDAVISAVLHRLESSLQTFYPSIKCTFIILMRRPCSSNKRYGRECGDASVSSMSERVTDEGESGVTGSFDHDDKEDDDDVVTDTDNQSNIKDETNVTANPRLPGDERYYLHTNASMIRKLVAILLQHYPERLSRALIVPALGNVAYFRTVVGGRLALASVVGSVRTRSKVKFLKHFSELKIYVKTDELVTIVGGSSPIDQSVFEAR